MQPTFDKCSTPTDADAPDLIEHENEHNRTTEHATVSAEIDLDGRLDNKCASAARAVLYTITGLTPLLPNIGFSSSNGYHIDRRRVGYEPNIIFKVADTDGDERVRIIGDFKSCTACNISKMILKLESTGRKSFRSLLGKQMHLEAISALMTLTSRAGIQDMLAVSVKNGFMSTYNETVFLKIDRRSNANENGLSRSTIFHDYDTTTSEMTGDAQTFSSSLALLFLMQTIAKPKTGNYQNPVFQA